MFTLSAPAKINWFLNILRKRQDGYHDILSLMQCVTLYDSLSFEQSEETDVVTDAPIPLAQNLVYKAAMLMKETARVSTGARITLKKETPLQAGLGGGSSDAAFTIMGLNRLWSLGLSQGEMMKLGETLGSDVPFFFNGAVALAEGRGEVVSPLRINKSYTILLVKPTINVSTEWAYSQVDSSREGLTKKANNIKLFCQALENGDFGLLSSIQGNDLELLVVRKYPVIDEIKQELLNSGAVFSSMSGSGPTVFGVFETDEKTVAAREYMAPYWCRVVKTLTSGECLVKE